MIKTHTKLHFLQHFSADVFGLVIVIALESWKSLSVFDSCLTKKPWVIRRNGHLGGTRKADSLKLKKDTMYMYSKNGNLTWHSMTCIYDELISPGLTTRKSLGLSANIVLHTWAWPRWLNSSANYATARKPRELMPPQQCGVEGSWWTLMTSHCFRLPIIATERSVIWLNRGLSLGAS